MSSNFRVAPLGLIAAAGLLAGCAQLPEGAEFSDPYEAKNRGVHDTNVEIDRTLFGDGKQKGIIPTFPRPLAKGFINFASNLAAPGDVVNRVLQGKPKPAIETTLRFVINTTVGIGGLFDPATAMGIEKDETDFGETLAVWGSGEGDYIVIPIIGPSTERDAVGFVVDLVLDPLNVLLPRPESSYALVAAAASSAASRQVNADLVESILYESADGYAQARIIYLQNRRYELGEDIYVIDPYEDPYGQ
ncbi:VacJ family lipoprotein [Albidovulum sediminicola]|uniref:VacJ family lipoprotein n=1 Tax=Albidovulum sediminicola TaxID=2984331 RepID=A0ABT2YZ42_9RHOB|nr:VacJ family lipoprotein [Defluviimonas sp. WL0075]MCV2864126.1 VacJ family lipoprotein [Defluviimonas sp. WL0075]